jgi:hypothetical protein
VNIDKGTLFVISSNGGEVIEASEIAVFSLLFFKLNSERPSGCNDSGESVRVRHVDNVEF